MSYNFRDNDRKLAGYIAGVLGRLGHAMNPTIMSTPSVQRGDYNVVPTDADIYSLRSWRENALVQPEPRAAYARLLDAGWTDAIDALHSAEPMYTFWHYLRDSWARNAGLRLDHLLLSRALAPRLKNAGVDRQTRAAENASDHAPAWIELADSGVDN